MFPRRNSETGTCRGDRCATRPLGPQAAPAPPVGVVDRRWCHRPRPISEGRDHRSPHGSNAVRRKSGSVADATGQGASPVRLALGDGARGVRGTIRVSLARSSAVSAITASGRWTRRGPRPLSCETQPSTRSNRQAPARRTSRPNLQAGSPRAACPVPTGTGPPGSTPNKRAARQRRRRLLSDRVAPRLSIGTPERRA